MKWKLDYISSFPSFEHLSASSLHLMKSTREGLTRVCSSKIVFIIYWTRVSAIKMKFFFLHRLFLSEEERRKKLESWEFYSTIFFYPSLGWWRWIKCESRLTKREERKLFWLSSLNLIRKRERKKDYFFLIPYFVDAWITFLVILIGFFSSIFCHFISFRHNFNKAYQRLHRLSTTSRTLTSPPQLYTIQTIITMIQSLNRSPSSAIFVIENLKTSPHWMDTWDFMADILRKKPTSKSLRRKSQMDHHYKRQVSVLELW